MLYSYEEIPETIRAPRLSRVSNLAKAGVPVVKGYVMDAKFLRKVAVEKRIVPGLFLKSFESRAGALKSLSVTFPQELEAFVSYRISVLNPKLVLPPVFSTSLEKSILHLWNIYLSYKIKPSIPHFLIQESKGEPEGYFFPFHPMKGKPGIVLIRYFRSSYLCSSSPFAILKAVERTERLTHRDLKKLCEINAMIKKQIGRPTGFSFFLRKQGIRIQDVQDIYPGLREQYVYYYYALTSSTN